MTSTRILALTIQELIDELTKFLMKMRRKEWLLLNESKETQTYKRERPGSDDDDDTWVNYPRKLAKTLNVLVAGNTFDC